ncbi:hypothetical protein DVH05_000496 [Phytophthora capsici]|nr:hypothetical protein DVH05_000496 [Phytophthora capsici]
MISPVKFLLASALTATVVNGHGWMSKPEATFKPEAGDKSQFIATIEASSSGFKGTFNTAPADNVASFTKAFKASSYKSLKALIDDKAKVTVTGATLTCGSADPNGPAQPLPATLEWSHSDSEGFTPSHEGPCEAWCDDTMVFNDENCAANFKTAPAEMPYEKSKCSGASKLTFYWMAMHGPTWQVYVNCAPLSGGSGGGTTQSSGTTDSSSAGSPAAQTPSTPSSGGSPSTPSSGGSPSTPTTDSSSADTPSVTPAPVSGGSPSTNTTPAPASGGSPSTSTTPAPASGGSPSTPTTEESDCGSYDVAGGSGDENQDNSTPATESDCGSYDVAGGSGDEGQDNNTPTTGGNTYQQQGGNTGTETQTNTGGSTNQGGNTGGNTDQWTNTGGNTNQWSNTGGNTNQWSNTGGNTNQWTNTGTQNTGTQQNTYQNTGTGSQNSYNFNTFQGNTNAGTVAPQKM